MARENTQVLEKSDNGKAVDRFLARHGWEKAQRFPFAKDSSSRRFIRLKEGGRTAVLLSAHEPMEDTEPFIFMGKKLASLGLRVPEVYAHDPDHHLILEEDLGECRYQEEITRPKANRRALYEAALQAQLVKATADPHLAFEDSVAYTWEYWEGRVRQLFLQYWPNELKQQPPLEAVDEFLTLFKPLIESTTRSGVVLLHGDFEPQNLFYHSEEAGAKACALVDFQDMTPARGNMLGSAAFDLVAFLQSARLTPDFHWETEMKELFFKELGSPHRKILEEEYAILGVALASKGLGLFSRLSQQDPLRAARYRPFLQNCWRNLEHNLNHPALRGLKDWYGRFMPDEVRQV